MEIKRAPLVEAGQPVALSFRGESHAAWRDLDSGYLQLDAPPAEVLADYYENEYGRDNPEYYKLELDYDPDRCNWGVSTILSTAERFGLTGPLETHELGCAYGGLVAEMARRGHAATGSDINGTAIREGASAKGNDRIQALPNREALARLGRKVDLIYTQHCLEHDPELWEVLAACRSALTTRGILFATVPNAMYARSLIDGFEAHEWAAYPDHLHHLSPGSIPKLCTVFGFEPLLVQTLSAGSFDQWWRRHFGETYDHPRVRKVLEFLFNRLGFGLELRLVLTRADGDMARAHRDHIAALRAELEVRRRDELEIRAFIETVGQEPG